MRRFRIVASGVLGVVALAACSPEATQEVAEAPAVVETEAVEVEAPATVSDEFAVFFADAGPVLIAGQPTEAGLEAMKAQGVSKVINLRTEAEMSNRDLVPFDEAAKLDELGMAYVVIPQGPEETYTPEAVDAFAAALADADGQVLVHCGSGVRASHMWAAYLVRERGVSLEEALKQAEALNLKSEEPVRALLGISG